MKRIFSCERENSVHCSTGSPLLHAHNKITVKANINNADNFFTLIFYKENG
ncbi:MAG TPA: hypothetical protein PKZ64_06640 [Spirochaetota bacterium]|nr:hypothetical protein [Spirochaetota bacterium]HPR37660.1 hypothetical protein [Spirochaetota bacterium]